MTRILKNAFMLLMLTLLLEAVGCGKPTRYVVLDTVAEWERATFRASSVMTMKTLDVGGKFDLIENGALLLQKQHPESLFARSTPFVARGEWESDWLDLGADARVESVFVDWIVYGNPIDITDAWVKFSGNPVASGGNDLLPFDSSNVTDQTVVLPPPGGVPQDPSILRGAGPWGGRWLLLFNHTPRAWPHQYYWSFLVADSLAPLKRGVNPFQLAENHYPLYGPVEGLAPNDWIEINGRYYAPGETYRGTPHLWISDDLLHWQLAGTIRGLVGTDPGICYDGARFHLFSENGQLLMHCILDVDSVKALKNEVAIEVGDHTGDADCNFFNNQWHVFFDDGPHLHYWLGHAVTCPSDFPRGWQVTNDFFGPHRPEQGQRWDDDDEGGNRFGTGDADIALEGTTLYLCYERPIGVAYRELSEVYDDRDQTVLIQVLLDRDENGAADDSTGWLAVRPGGAPWHSVRSLRGTRIKLRLGLHSERAQESPLIRKVVVIAKS